LAEIVSSGATHDPEMTALAWDGDPGTRWTSGIPMEPTMAFWVTLDKPSMISGVAANAGVDTDSPASWKVAVMDDEAGHGRQEVDAGEGPIVAEWTPVRGQVVRIECLSSDPQWWWSITDLTVEATETVALPEPPPDEEVGPAVFNEVLARYWVERWAAKFNWRLIQREVVDFQGGMIGVEQWMVYEVARARDKGILTPWPFEV
jgi:hypothetical protein